jgi:hypothetical protein
LIEEDEDDVEGEKIMSDIKNLNNERFFNMYHIDLDSDLLDDKLAFERLKEQGDLANTMKTTKINEKELHKAMHQK